jgi:hypothetical protein
MAWSRVLSFWGLTGMDAIDERELTTSGAGPRLARRGDRCRDQGHYPGVSLDEAFFERSWPRTRSRGPSREGTEQRLNRRPTAEAPCPQLTPRAGLFPRPSWHTAARQLARIRGRRAREGQASSSVTNLRAASERDSFPLSRQSLGRQARQSSRRVALLPMPTAESRAE